jgi:hypothetical protein
MPPWRLPKIELPGSVALVSGQGDRFRRNLSVHYGMAWAKVGSPPDFADAGQPREGRLWGIVAHTLCRRPPAAERRKRPSADRDPTDWSSLTGRRHRSVWRPGRRAAPDPR